MAPGLPRWDALQELERRTEVPDLSNFVLAPTRADALGVPSGRVLETQTLEIRLERHQRARAKAAKVSARIMFPLPLFIFPSVSTVMLGPAVSAIGGKR